MTLYEFRTLDDREQLEAIEMGAHIGEREDSEHWILLYHLGEFYAEVFYHKQNGVIDKHNAFATTHRLTAYLNQIDISFIQTLISDEGDNS